MYFFVSQRRSAKADEPEIKLTNSYIEIESSIDKESSMFMYIIPRSEHSAFIAICLDDMFDSIVSDLDEDTFETIVDTWPTLAQLLVNGVNDKYQNGALIRLEDADYGDNKWFVASIAGNISFDSQESLFCDRTSETIGLVLEKTTQLLSEVQEREPSTLKAIGKGILAGLGLGLLSGAAQALGIDIDE